MKTSLALQYGGFVSRDCPVANDLNKQLNYTLFWLLLIYFVYNLRENHGFSV